MSTPTLTRVVLRDRSGRALEHWLGRLAFGRPVSEDRVAGTAGTDTIYHFLPGELFCLVWWRRRPRGGQQWVLAVLEAPRTPGSGLSLPDTHPAVVVHAMVEQPFAAGQDGSVDRMLELIQTTRESGADPSRLPARYWQDAAWRIVFRREPVPVPRPDAAGSEETRCDA